VTATGIVVDTVRSSSPHAPETTVIDTSCWPARLGSKGTSKRAVRPGPSDPAACGLPLRPIRQALSPKEPSPAPNARRTALTAASGSLATIEIVRPSSEGVTSVDTIVGSATAGGADSSPAAIATAKSVFTWRIPANQRGTGAKSDAPPLSRM
jgi:hypothetical protein